MSLFKSVALALCIGALSVLLGGCSGPMAYQSSPNMSAPSGLTEYTSELGFSLGLPPGWSVTAEPDPAAEFPSVMFQREGTSAVFSLVCYKGAGAAFLGKGTLAQIARDSIASLNPKAMGWGSFPATTLKVEVPGFDPEFEAYQLLVSSEGKMMEMVSIIGWRLDNFGECKYRFMGIAGKADAAYLTEDVIRILHHLH